MKKEWLVGVIRLTTDTQLCTVLREESTARRKERVREKREDDEPSLLRMDGWLARGERESRLLAHGEKVGRARTFCCALSSIFVSKEESQNQDFLPLSENIRRQVDLRSPGEQRSRVFRLNQSIVSLSFRCPFNPTPCCWKNEKTEKSLLFYCECLTCKTQ